MSGIILEYPIALIIPFIFLICLKYCKPKFLAIFFPNTDILKRAARKRSVFLNILKFLTILLLSISLASPIKEDEIVTNENRGYEISLILDVSGSMAQYNKFKIVKSIVSDFIKKRKNDKLALTIFADFAYVAIPLTYDKQSIQRLLDKIDVGIAGTHRTALYEALFMSTKLFKNSKAKNKIAILLTDGMDNAGTIPLDVAINTAKKYKIKVYTIGVGGRGEYNPYVLREIAKETGGKFFEADSADRLKKIYNEIDKLEKSEIKTNKFVKKSYYFQYPLFLAILFMSILIILNTNIRERKI